MFEGLRIAKKYVYDERVLASKGTQLQKQYFETEELQMKVDGVWLPIPIEIVFDKPAAKQEFDDKKPK